MTRYRYPGLNAYAKEDAPVFKGRERDSSALFREVNLNKTLVLHADSGMGKSSLIQAGLLPVIESNDKSFVPILISLADLKEDSSSELLLVDFTMKKICEEVPSLHTKSLQLTKDLPGKRLWIMNKLLEKDAQRFLLIFDQFERLQAFSARQIQHFKKELFDLLNEKIPVDLYAILEKIMRSFSQEEQESLKIEYEILTRPSAAKAVFVVREDKLGTMTLLSDFFPDILKHDLTIGALSKEDAIRVISEPAAAKGDFYSTDFSFEEQAVLVGLIEKIADKETKLVDPIELQIVARDLERNVVIGGGKKVICASDISEVDDIIVKFYKDCWNKVSVSLRLRRKQLFDVKSDIVPLLITKKRRDLVMSDRIPAGKPNDAVTILVNEGLVREVRSGTDVFYQLCHDRLINPVEKDAIDLSRRKKRRQFRRKMLRWGLGIFSTICVVASLIFFLGRPKDDMYQAQHLAISEAGTIVRSNPTLAYRILKIYQRSALFYPSDELSKALSQLENPAYSYEKMVYPIDGIRGSVTTVDEMGITVVDERSITKWAPGDELILSRTSLNTGFYIGTKMIAGKDYFFVLDDDSLLVRNKNGKVVKRFYSQESTGDNLDVSSDGRYILIGNKVYNYRTEKLVGMLSAGLKAHVLNQTTSCFLHDGNHVAVGYASGQKIIYLIDEGRRKKVSVSAIYLPQGEDVNNGISCLAVDARDSFLYAGTNQNTIECWKIGKLDSTDLIIKRQRKKQIVFENIISHEPFKVYRGHSGKINSIAISSGDSILLSGSDDNTALLWNVATGRRVSICKGADGEVKKVGFLMGKSNEMYAITEYGLLYIWSRDKPSKLYARNEMANISPFEFYSLGIGRGNDEFKGHIYDTAVVVDKLFSNTLHYIVTMPSSNKYPEDSGYLDNIRYSLSEIDSMMSNLTSNKDFQNRISILNKRQLYDRYSTLILIEPSLLLYDDNEHFDRKTRRYLKSLELKIKGLLLDTSGVQISSRYAYELMMIGGWFLDSLKDQRQAIYCDKQACNLMEIFSLKFPTDKGLRSSLISTYGDYALTCLYARVFDSALKAVDRLKHIQDGDGIAGLREIELLLLKNDYGGAVRLFEKKEDVIVRPDQEDIFDATPLRQWLIPRLQKFIDRGISTDAMVKFMRFLKARSDPAHLKPE